MALSIQNVRTIALCVEWYDEPMRLEDICDAGCDNRIHYDVLAARRRESRVWGVMAEGFRVHAEEVHHDAFSMRNFKPDGSPLWIGPEREGPRAGVEVRGRLTLVNPGRIEPVPTGLIDVPTRRAELMAELAELDRIESGEPTKPVEVRPAVLRRRQVKRSTTSLKSNGGITP